MRFSDLIFLCDSEENGPPIAVEKDLSDSLLHNSLPNVSTPQKTMQHFVQVTANGFPARDWEAWVVGDGIWEVSHQVTAGTDRRRFLLIRIIP